MDTACTVDGNRLTVLTGGAERLDALVTLIEGARTSLKLLYYIFTEDDAGTRVREAMIDAANRGVTVRLIIDGFGSHADGNDRFLVPLREAGIDVCLFIPRFGRRYLLRNHQKFAIADETRALIGGFNIGNAYFEDAGPKAWRDLGLMIEGPATERLTGYFDVLADWTHQPRSKMRDLTRALAEWSNPKGPVRWLHGGPTRRFSPWVRTLRFDLRPAHDVSIVAAYFAPTPGLTKRLDGVGQRGRARVVTAGKTDNNTTIGAARFTFPGLMKKGVRVFEYQPHRLHTKLYVIDDIVHIGSANFDPRSLYLNLEIMLRVQDAAFADAMRRYVDGEVAESRERHLNEFRGITTVPDRIRNAFCWFLVAVLDPGITRRLNMGVD